MDGSDAKYHYAECRLCHILTVIIMNVIFLNVAMQIVIQLSAIMNNARCYYAEYHFVKCRVSLFLVSLCFVP
jgi:hypothetical protein